MKSLVVALLLAQTAAGYRNLVVNGGAGERTDGWGTSPTNADVEDCGNRNNCFVVRRMGGFVQDFRLPLYRKGDLALAVGFVRAERLTLDTGITDRPNLHVTFMNQDQTRILYTKRLVSLATGIYTGSSPDWQRVWTAFEIPDGAAWGTLRLSLGSRKGIEQDGSRGWFDDVAVFVVPSEDDARSIVSNYTRTGR